MLPQEDMKIEGFDTGLHCHYCHRRLIDPRTPEGTAPFYVVHPTGTMALGERYGILSYDHKVSRRAGGLNTANNRVPACKMCNEDKADGEYAAFYAATAQERTINQLREALDILKQHVGEGLIASGAPLSVTEYNHAKHVIKRATALYINGFTPQAVNHGAE